MKEFYKDIWVDTQEDGTVKVGLTRNFIESKLTECFHIIQADAQEVRKGGPMLVVETNDGLSSLKSPVSGRIIRFNDRARNFPDKMTEDEVILVLNTKPREKPAEIIRQQIFGDNPFAAAPPPPDWQVFNVAPPPRAPRRG